MSERGTPCIEIPATIQPQWGGHAGTTAVHPYRVKAEGRNTCAPGIRGREVMEAQGIEPWSEPAFSAASTCVGRCLCVVPGRSSANLPGTNLRRISPAASEDHVRPARLCYSTPTPRTGSVAEGAFASLAQLRQPAPNQSWQLNVSKRFYQGPGPGHAAIPSTDPSKPVAPVLEVHEA